jgi:hypothetical protein
LLPLAVGWFVWGGLLGFIYLMALITAGVMTLRNGHIVMFIIGFVFPLLWIFGAIMDRPRY